MAQLLVVDDNATNLTLFRPLLQKIENAEVQCFAEASRTLEWCVDN